MMSKIVKTTPAKIAYTYNISPSDVRKLILAEVNKRIMESQPTISQIEVLSDCNIVARSNHLDIFGNDTSIYNFYVSVLWEAEERRRD